MQKKLFLFPYRFQIIEWIIVCISLIATIVGVLFSKGSSDIMSTVAIAGYEVVLIGAFIAGLSREKTEHEFTLYLRTSSALTAIAIMLGLRFIFALTTVLMISLSATDLIGEEVFVNNPFMASLVKSAKEVTNYGGAFLLYLIIYKIRLLHYLKEDGHEE